MDEISRRAGQTHLAASRIWGQVNQGENSVAERHEPKIVGDEIRFGSDELLALRGRCLERARLPGLGEMGAALPLGEVALAGASGYLA